MEEIKKTEHDRSSIKKVNGKRGAERKDKKITDIGYFRVITIKKDTSKDALINFSKKYDAIATSSSGTSSVLHLFSGEKKEVIFLLTSYNNNMILFRRDQ